MIRPVSSFLEARLARLRADLHERGLDAFIVTPPSNIRYLSNHIGSAGVLVVTATEVHLVVDFRYQESVRQLQASTGACPGLRIWDVPDTYEASLLRLVSELGLRTIGFEAAHVTVARHAWWVGTAATRGLTVDFVPTDRVVERLRVVKDAFEIDTLRRAAAGMTGVVEAVLPQLRAGLVERDVAEQIESAMRRAGYERPAFDTIVASGPNGALPHHRAASRRFEAGDLVVLDFGGVLDGYCSDLTRTVSVGVPSDEARRLYDAVRDAQAAAIAAVRPGIPATDVDRAARQVLDARGFGPAFGHGTGHGLGLDVHEEPRVSRPQPDVTAVLLEPGMVFTIEPGAYLSGFGGVRIEDDVLVTATGGELLTHVPTDLWICQA